MNSMPNDSARMLASEYAQEKCKNLLTTAPSANEPTVAGTGTGRRRKKNISEMDEDEKLLASEEGKKMTSKERRQVRNRVSARQFRLRRKEYITHLEGLVCDMTSEMDELKKTIIDLKNQNDQLLTDRRELQHADHVQSQCDRGCNSCQRCSQARLGQRKVLYKGYVEIPIPSGATTSSNTSTTSPPPLGGLTSSMSPEAPFTQPPPPLHQPVSSVMQPPLPSHSTSELQPPQLTQVQVTPTPVAASSVHAAPVGHHQIIDDTFYHQSQIPVTSGQENSTNLRINPNVASLLPQYGWNATRTAASYHNQRPNPQFGNHGHEAGSSISGSSDEWALDYGDDKSASLSMPNPRIYSSFIPEIEKMLDEKFSQDEDELNGNSDADNKDNKDDKRLKLALAAAEDMFKKLDIHLSGMSLDGSN